MIYFAYLLIQMVLCYFGSLRLHKESVIFRGLFVLRSLLEVIFIYYFYKINKIIIFFNILIIDDKVIIF